MWSAGLGFRPPRYLWSQGSHRQTECKMAHSCRWRFPARPGGSSNSGTGRRAGRIRVTASLCSVSGAHPNAAGLGPGFDAALQVSSVIGSNLQKFRDVLGESSDSSSGEVSTGQGESKPDGYSGPSVKQLQSLVYLESCLRWWAYDYSLLKRWSYFPLLNVLQCGCEQTCHFQDAQLTELAVWP